jgi:hypothetical protein
MATPFDLSDYKCVNLPARLWRVAHGNTQSRMVNRDLVAVDKLRNFQDEDGLKKAVEEHVN